MALKPALIQEIISKGLELNKPHSILDNNGMLKSKLELKTNKISDSINSQIMSSPELKMAFVELKQKEEKNIINDEIGNDKISQKTVNNTELNETPELEIEEVVVDNKEEASVNSNPVEISTPKKGRRPKNS